MLLSLVVTLSGCGGTSNSSTSPSKNVTYTVNEAGKREDIQAITSSPGSGTAEIALRSAITVKAPSSVGTPKVKSIKLKFYGTEVTEGKVDSEVKNILIYEQSVDISETTIEQNPNGSVTIFFNSIDLSGLWSLPFEQISKIERLEFEVEFENLPPIDTEEDPPLNPSDEYIKAKAPVIIVSAGQSGGPYVAMALLDRAKLGYDYADAPNVTHLASGVGLPAYDPNDSNVLPVQIESNCNYPQGTPYKTMIMVMGASLKGMGASGLTIDTELKRVQANISWARKNNVTIIGMHIEGKSLRTPNDELVISTVAPYCDMIIVTEGSNFDGKFSDLANRYNIPISVAKNVSAIVPIMNKVFSK